MLFVDDEVNLVRTIPPILSMHGFTVTAVMNMDDAFEAIARKRFDILLTDLSIAGPDDGHRIVCVMRVTQPHAKTAILTGHPESPKHTGPSAPDRYLAKPISPTTLVATLREMLAS